MILLVTPSSRIADCVHALQTALGRPVESAGTLPAATALLRAREYAAVVIDQFLLDADPDGSEQMLQHLGGAVPVYVNCAISGVERVVREVRTALNRRQREERILRQSAERAVWNELRETVTAMLLSCDLVLESSGVSPAAARRIQTIHELANTIRTRLEGGDRP
jgi:PAS domain-containing protein